MPICEDAILTDHIRQIELTDLVQAHGLAVGRSAFLRSNESIRYTLTAVMGSVIISASAPVRSERPREQVQGQPLRTQLAASFRGIGSSSRAAKSSLVEADSYTTSNDVP